ncbi:MAG: hypothetical protein ACK4S6_16285 [Roseateles asaccharophilus]|uniref:hypothetical protein n=1 Tax=Roseateles asaccharophilus TaxID=582607 RepID=UPI00391DC2BF
MKTAIRYAINRLREPSTQAGLAGLALLVGMPPGTVDALAQIVGGLASLAAILKPEGGGHA